MSVTRVGFRTIEALEGLFDEVVEAWGLSFSEREAVRGLALRGDVDGRRRRSRFLTERMALVIEIDWLLGQRMDAREVRLWVRRRVAAVAGSSPLDEMVGSTDRLRRIRTLLTLECEQ